MLLDEGYMSYVNNNHGALLDVRYKINSYVALGAGVGAFILDLEDLDADKAIYTSARVNLSKDTETVFSRFQVGRNGHRWVSRIPLGYISRI